MPDVDFSRNASVYDRRHGALLDTLRSKAAGLPVREIRWTIYRR